MKGFSKDVLRTITSFVLTFILCLGVSLFTALTSFFIFTGSTFIVNSAEKSKYTEYAYSELVGDFNDLAIPSGLPQDFFNEKVNYKKFCENFYGCLNNIISKTESFDEDLKDVENEILKLITDYSASAGGELSDSTQKALKEFSSECISIYSSYVKPSLIDYAFSLIAPFKKYLPLGMLISAFLSIFAGFMLFKINRNSSFKKYCYTSFMSAALTVGVIPFILIATKEVAKLLITKESLHEITTGFINDFLWLMVVSGILLAVISLIIINFDKIKLLIFKK